MANDQSLVIADYGPYRTGQAPGTANLPTDAQIDQDLSIIATFANTVRIYSLTDDGVYIAQKAASDGLKVIPAAYLYNPYGTPDPRYSFADLLQDPANQQELTDLINYLNDPTTNLANIPIVVIGNEAISQVGAWNDTAVIDAINYVKSQTPAAVAAGVQFTTAESAGGQYYINNPEAPSDHHTNLGAAVDVIFANIFPYWEGVSIDDAVNQVILEYNELKATYPGKQIVISETGWPSSGPTEGAAVASPENQQAFWSAFIAAANQDGIAYSMFEAFDEPYKEGTQPEPNPEAHWGIFDVNRDAKLSLTNLAIAPANAVQPEGQSGITPFTFTVTRTGDVSGAQSVNWAVSGSGTSPADPADFNTGTSFPTGTVNFADGQSTQTITVDVSGDATVEPNEGFTVTLSDPSAIAAIVTPAANGTILNDDTSNVLFMNTNDSDIAYWTVQNGVRTGAVSLGSPGSGWSVVGTGDFNGDGTTDILFQNTNGTVAEWLIQNGQVQAAKVVGALSNDWTIIGTGDLNGDGTDDVVLRSTEGAIGEWQMPNGQAEATIIGSVSSNWISASVGDLNGDGTADLLFIGTDGTVADWWIQNGQEVSAHVLGNVGTQWSIVGLGNFDGSGQNDILFQSTDGDIAAWMMQNGAVTAARSFGSPGPGWQVVGIGDYNGDGTSDILLRNTNGAMATWIMQNGQVSQVVSMGGITSDWQTAPAQTGVILPS